MLGPFARFQPTWHLNCDYLVDLRGPIGLMGGFAPHAESDRIGRHRQTSVSTRVR